MSEKHPSVSIVTVNYNGKKHLKQCLDSLFGLQYPKRKLQIIVSDNGSTDGSVEFVRRKYPQAKIIVNADNNFCRANNRAVEQARGDFVGLVNNDAAVEPQWLEELVKVLGPDEQWAGACGKVLFPDGTLQDTGHWELPDFYWFMRGLRDDGLTGNDEMREVQTLSNCASLYRREYWKQVGGLDEDFVMYYEDVDFCLRCRARGWKFVYVPTAVTRHKLAGSGTDESRRAFVERSRLLFVAKHFPEKLGGVLERTGYYNVVQDPGGKRDVVGALPEVMRKLMDEHPAEKVQTVMEEVLAGVRKVYRGERIHLIEWLGKAEERRGTLERHAEGLLADLGRLEQVLQDTRAGRDEVASRLERVQAEMEEARKLASDTLMQLEESRGGKAELERQVAELDARLSRSAYLMQRVSLRSPSQLSEAAVNRILIVKPYGVSPAEMDAAVERFRKVFPEARLSLLANLDESDYLALLEGARFHEKLLFSPMRRPLTRRRLLALCLRLRCSRFDLGIALQSRAGYAGDDRARVLARLGGRRWCTFPPPQPKKLEAVGLSTLRKELPRGKGRGWRVPSSDGLKFASFLTVEKRARRGVKNKYIVRISNPSTEVTRGYVSIGIYARSDPSEARGHHASMSKAVVVQPGTVLQMLLEYDWEARALFSVEGVAAAPDEFRRGPAEAGQLYWLRATLSGETGRIWDQADVFQQS